jgi:hypothetical protein
MKRDHYVVISPFKVYEAEGDSSRTMKKDEHLWAEMPLGEETVVVYLDTLPLWAYRMEFDASTVTYESSKDV